MGQHIKAKSADPHLGVIQTLDKVDKGLLIETHYYSPDTSYTLFRLEKSTIMFF